jgi:two-component system nitrate/nitrite response regulator NarL
MTDRKIRVVLADDHPLFRDGVARTLVESDLFEVVGQASTGREAVAMIAAHKPDIALLDISMPDGGLWALSQVMTSPEPPRVAMLTVSEEDDDVMQALKAGATGYLLKGVGAQELVSVVSDLAAGRSYLAPSLAIKVLAAMNAPRAAPADDDQLDGLTKREEDILRLVSEGKSNKEVGRALDLQEKTVKHYMTTILQKLQVRNRTEAALLARDRFGR